jgi:hypothetical protein
VFASTMIILIDLVLKTSISGSLKLLSLYSAFLLFLALYYYRITSNFLVNKLYDKGNLPPLAKQVTKTL